jgi:dihydroxyacetone kinase-like predicted kinase
MNPSTQQILDAVERVRAQTVVVLPNNKNIVAVAEQAVGLASRPVHVVPTHSVVEALAALLELDPDVPAEANAAAMAAAATRVRTGEVTQAVRDGVGECGPIRAGDWIGITRAGIGTRASSALDAAIGVVDALVAESDELVTILVGAEADPADVDRLRAHLAAARPAVEVEVHDGGQPLYPFLVGVE